MSTTEYRHPGLTLEQRVKAYLDSPIGAPVTRGLVIDLMAELADARAGAVAEEPEWEYGFNWVDHPYGEPHMVALGADEDIAAWVTRVEAEVGEVRLFQRTAPNTAGEWVPVKQEGAET